MSPQSNHMEKNMLESYTFKLANNQQQFRDLSKQGPSLSWTSWLMSLVEFRTLSAVVPQDSSRASVLT